MIDIDSEFECSTHSDDVVYTAERCEHYDDNLCEGIHSYISLQLLLAVFV